MAAVILNSLVALTMPLGPPLCPHSRINCMPHQRQPKTLDLFYANTKEAYTSTPLPTLGRVGPQPGAPRARVQTPWSTAVEDILRGTGTKDPVAQGLQHLQAGGNNIPPE